MERSLVTVTLVASGCGTLEGLVHHPLLVSQCWAPTETWLLIAIYFLDQGALPAYCALQDHLVAAFCGLFPQKEADELSFTLGQVEGIPYVPTNSLRHLPLMPAMPQHRHGKRCCCLNSGSLDTESLSASWLGAGDLLKDDKKSHLTWLLFANLF